MIAVMDSKGEWWELGIMSWTFSQGRLGMWECWAFVGYPRPLPAYHRICLPVFTEWWP